MRRLTRLEPPYLVTLLLIFASQLLLNTGAWGEILPHLLASTLYVHNIIYGTWSTINPVAWSLEVEVQFYCAAPFIAWLIYRIRSAGLRRVLWIVIAFGSICVQSYADPALRAAHLDKSIICFAQFFALGMLFAELRTLCMSKEPTTHWTWDVLALGGLCGAFTFSLSTTFFPKIFYAVSLAALFWGGLHGKLLSQFLRTRLVYVIGGMCYSIYLIHYALIFLLTKLLPPPVSRGPLRDTAFAAGTGSDPTHPVGECRALCAHRTTVHAPGLAQETRTLYLWLGAQSRIPLTPVQIVNASGTKSGLERRLRISSSPKPSS